MAKQFTLIVCTYMRAKPLLTLLKSVAEQTLYPDEILIIDGSTNSDTEQMLVSNTFKNLQYHKVDDENRGLTKQRNYGINLVAESSEIICFLDDDIILENEYFEHLIQTYNTNEDALAVGGYITNEVKWKKTSEAKKTTTFHFDGWMREEPFRYRLRGKFGLLPETAPGFMPAASHGRPISFLPPSGKTYKVELLMGGVSSFKKEIFKTLSFSTYFEGYGLYEDADFSLRVAKQGAIYVNTKARLGHYHDASGRPNKYEYGKMVIKNGWYVWLVKYPKPKFSSKFKWYITALLLTLVRLTNVINTNKKQEAVTESLGRFVGLLSLLIK